MDLKKLNWAEFLRRLKQPSTLKGLLVLLMTLGYKIDPTHIDIYVVGFGICFQLVEGLRDEYKIN